MRVLNAAVTTKMCHARPGDLISFPGHTGVYMLIVLPHEPTTITGAEDPINTHTEGLYADPRPMALASVETGITRKLPHLSSRVEIHRDAVILYHNPLATPTQENCR